MSRLALLAVFLFPLAVVGAPVPPQPRERELTPALLVGSWSYSWGDRRDGRITFYGDMTYWSHHDPEWKITHVGTWRVSGSTVTLTEYIVQPTGGLFGPTEYVFTLAPQGDAGFAGKTPGGVVVALSERER